MGNVKGWDTNGAFFFPEGGRFYCVYREFQEWMKSCLIFEGIESPFGDVLTPYPFTIYRSLLHMLCITGFGIGWVAWTILLWL